MSRFILDLDRPRELVFDFDAWDLIAEKYSSGDEGEDFDLGKIKPKEIPFLAFAGLRWEDSELTEEKMRDLLKMAIREGKATIIEVTKRVSDALNSQSGASKLDEGKKAEGPAAIIPGTRKRGK